MAPVQLWRVFDLLVPPVTCDIFTGDPFPDQDQSPAVEEVLLGLKVDLLVPYSQLTLSSWSELPDSCLSFGVHASPTRWYVFSEAEEVRQARTELKALQQVRERPAGGSELIGFGSVLTLFFFPDVRAPQPPSAPPPLAGQLLGAGGEPGSPGRLSCPPTLLLLLPCLRHAPPPARRHV